MKLAVPPDGAAVRLGVLVEDAVQRHGAIALILDRPLDVAADLGCEIDYARFGALIVQASGWLHAAGLRAGESVAIIKRNNMDMLVLAAAASRLGAVPALIAPVFDAATVDVLLRRLGRPLVISDRETVRRCRLLRAAGPARVVVVDGSADGAIALDALRERARRRRCCAAPTRLPPSRTPPARPAHRSSVFTRAAAWPGRHACRSSRAACCSVAATRSRPA